jgi:hypothetical protein
MEIMECGGALEALQGIPSVVGNLAARSYPRKEILNPMRFLTVPLYV